MPKDVDFSALDLHIIDTLGVYIKGFLDLLFSPLKSNVISCVE